MDYKEKVLKQWELPHNSKVKLESGKFVTFLKMDGMYAQWDEDGRFCIGNFGGFIKKENYYQVVSGARDAIDRRTRNYVKKKQEEN